MEPKRSLDEQTADYLIGISQRLPRRGVFAAVGRFTLRIAGISLLPVLPVNRAFAQFACSGWALCNMHGRFCPACCGHGARQSECPSCTVTDLSWTGCCSPDGCTNFLVRYKDCCANAGVATDCANGSWCGIGGSCPDNWPAYCQNNREFRCTIVEVTQTPCGPRTPSCL